MQAGILAQERVGGSRGEIGGFGERVEAAIATLQSSRLANAEAASRIEDLDVASQVSKVVGDSIRVQGGVALQAQANQSAAVALTLL